MKVNRWTYSHCLFVLHLTSVTFGYGWILDTKFNKFSANNWIWIFKKFIRYGSGVKKSISTHLCSAVHDTSGLTAPLSHICNWCELHYIHPLKCLNLCKNSFCYYVGIKSQNNEIRKSWSWSGNLKTVVRTRSGLFKMCWILQDSSPEILILYNSGLYQRWEESHFSESDSTPAPRFKTPAPTSKNFEPSTPTPVKTPKTSK